MSRPIVTAHVIALQLALFIHHKPIIDDISPALQL